MLAYRPPAAFTAGTNFPLLDLLCPFTSLKSKESIPLSSLQRETFSTSSDDKLKCYTQSEDPATPAESLGISEHSSQTLLMQTALCTQVHSPFQVGGKHRPSPPQVSLKSELQVVPSHSMKPPLLTSLTQVSELTPLRGSLV